MKLLSFEDNIDLALGNESTDQSEHLTLYSK